MSDINQLVLEAINPSLQAPVLKPNSKGIFEKIKNKVKRFYNKHEDNIDPVIDTATNFI